MNKLVASLRSMICGWVACNILFWICNLSWMVNRYKSLSDYIGYSIFMGVCTGIVIMCAWLVIFLPVDLWIADNSKLRRPWVASVCGFVAGGLVTVVLWPSFEGADWLEKVTSMKFSLQDMPYVLGPSITGMVAAYIRSFDRDPLLKTP